MIISFILWDRVDIVFRMLPRIFDACSSHFDFLEASGEMHQIKVHIVKAKFSETLIFWIKSGLVEKVPEVLSFL